jgi:hypothetical protein
MRNHRLRIDTGTIAQAVSLSILLVTSKGQFEGKLH